MRLVQVVAPGTSVPSMVKGVSENEFRQMNNFPLSHPFEYPFIEYGTSMELV